MSVRGAEAVMPSVLRPAQPSIHHVRPSMHSMALRHALWDGRTGCYGRRDVPRRAHRGHADIPAGRPYGLSARAARAGRRDRRVGPTTRGFGPAGGCDAYALAQSSLPSRPRQSGCLTVRPRPSASHEGQPFGRVTPYESHSMSPAGRVTPRGAIQCGASTSGGGTPAPRSTAGASSPGRPRQTMIMPPGSGPDAPGTPVAPPAPPAPPEATAGSASSRPFQWMTCARKAFTALSKAG